MEGAGTPPFKLVGNDPVSFFTISLCVPCGGLSAACAGACAAHMPLTLVHSLCSAARSYT